MFNYTGIYIYIYIIYYISLGVNVYIYSLKDVNYIYFIRCRSKCIKLTKGHEICFRKMGTLKLSRV